MTLFWSKFGFGKCFGASSQSNHWADCHQLSCRIHFSSHITILLRDCSLLFRIREADTSNRHFLKIFGQFMKHPFLSFFTFPICFKCQTTIEWPTMCSLATSCIVVRGPASVMLSVGHCQLPNYWWPATAFLIFKGLVFFAELLEPPLHYPFIISSWTKSVVDAVSFLCCFTTDFDLR